MYIYGIVISANANFFSYSSMIILWWVAWLTLPNETDSALMSENQNSFIKTSTYKHEHGRSRWNES